MNARKQLRYAADPQLVAGVMVGGALLVLDAVLMLYAVLL